MESSENASLQTRDATEQAKAVKVTLEATPELRIFRIQEGGAEIYDANPTVEDKLTYDAQLMHEPTFPELNQSAQKVGEQLKLATEHLIRFKNLAMNLQAEANFSAEVVIPPPPSQDVQQKMMFIGIQSRHNQLKDCSIMLSNCLDRFKTLVQTERQILQGFQSLSGMRWKCPQFFSDSKNQASSWTLPPQKSTKRIQIDHKFVEVKRDEDNEVFSSFPLPLIEVQLRVDAYKTLSKEGKHSHDPPSSQKQKSKYTCSGLRHDISDLYNPVSNYYVATGFKNLHRLLMHISRVMDESQLWTIMIKSHRPMLNRLHTSHGTQKSPPEDLELRDDEAIIPIPNSQLIFIVRSQRPRGIGSKLNGKASKASAEHQNKDATTAVQQSVNERIKPIAVPYPTPKDKNSTFNGLNDSSDSDDQLDSDDQSQELDLDDDTDVAIMQDLVLLTLKQAYYIYLHGSTLDSSKFQLYPSQRSRPVLHQYIHSISSPVLNVIQHYRKVVHISRLLDDLALIVSTSTELGQLIFHWESTSLATSSVLHVTFNTFHQKYQVNFGTFFVSPVHGLEEPIDVLKHFVHSLNQNIVQSVAKHVRALIGTNSASVGLQSVTFPLGVKHAIMSKCNSDSSANFANALLAHFTIQTDESEPLNPSLELLTQFKGVPSGVEAKYPLNRNIWKQVPGSNFVDKISSIILQHR